MLFGLLYSLLHYLSFVKLFLIEIKRFLLKALIKNLLIGLIKIILKIILIQLICLLKCLNKILHKVPLKTLLEILHKILLKGKLKWPINNNKWMRFQVDKSRRSQNQNVRSPVRLSMVKLITQ